MRVAAVVLHYRYWPEISRSLDALLNGERAPDRLIVVDNCPGCEDAAHIEQAYPMAEVVRAVRNEGYAGGMNLGLDAVRGEDAVLLLTQDCVMDPAALKIMLEEFGDPGVGAAGPLVRVASSGRLWGAGGRVTRSGTEKNGHGDEFAAWSDTPAFDTEWTDGCCILLRGAAARGPISFDQRFFMYFEEVDYLMRLRELGWRVRVAPRAHAWQSPGNPGNRLFARNQLLLTSKHFGHRATVRLLLLQAREIARDFGAMRFKESSNRARGVLSFLLGIWGPMQRGDQPDQPDQP